MDFFERVRITLQSPTIRLWVAPWVPRDWGHFRALVTHRAKVKWNPSAKAKSQPHAKIAYQDHCIIPIHQACVWDGHKIFGRPGVWGHRPPLARTAIPQMSKIFGFTRARLSKSGLTGFSSGTQAWSSRSATSNRFMFSRTSNSQGEPFQCLC